MLDNFPTIKIVPTDKLVVHEHHDDQRTPPLIEKLKASGIIKNPPIVMPLHDDTGRYMVLDGANRTTALTRMGLPHTIAQVVEPDALPLELQTWNHVCWGISPEDFFDELNSIEEIDLEEIDPTVGMRQLYNHRILILVQRPDSPNTFAGFYDKGELVERIQLLHKVVDSYKTRASLDRTRVQQISALKNIYEDLSGLVIFPPFQISEVQQLTSEGYLFPPGITRFSIAPRALRLNYPLEALEADQSLEEKNSALTQWIQAKMAKKSVRFYAEPTVLFDE